MRPRTATSSSFINYTKGCPGPGQYNQDIKRDKSGYYIHSRHRSASGLVISRSGKRFDSSALENAKKIPGPGMYNNRLNTSNNGKYFVHKFRSSGAPLFGRDVRKISLDKSNTRKITPGPGAYHIQSEFGYYDPGASFAPSSTRRAPRYGVMNGTNGGSSKRAF